MKRLLPLLLVLMSLWLSVSCMGELSTPTPIPESEPTAEPIADSRTPRATATALPSATPTPVPTETPLPAPSPTPSTGYYRNAGLGFWFYYPEDWAREDFNGDIPAVRLTDPDNPLFVMAGAQLVQENRTVEEFAPDGLDRLGLAEAINITWPRANMTWPWPTSPPS